MEAELLPEQGTSIVGTVDVDRNLPVLNKLPLREELFINKDAEKYLR
jgi:hypothetical protein